MNNIIKPNPEWYAVHVKSRHEAKVNDRLTLKGIEAFLPTVERISKWKDRIHQQGTHKFKRRPRRKW